MAEKFWPELYSMKDVGGNRVFKALPDFVLNLLAFLHSNVEFERTFFKLIY